MKLSQYLFLSQKSTKNGAMESILKSCLVNQQCAGIFEFSPMGTKIIQNIENIIRSELNKIGALEVRLPLLQSGNLWEKSNRIDKYGKEMFKLSDRNNNTMVLAPTAEESALNLISKYVNSYKQLPVNIYQILEKYRDEMRPRFGLIRARQFTMKDGYSFCSNEKDAEQIYVDYYNAYLNIFKNLELDVIPVAAETGEIGGKFSHEFIVNCEFGEEYVYFEDLNFNKINCIEDLNKLNTSRINGKNSVNGLELGHIFYLGTVYSEQMECYFMNQEGQQQPYIMGCYGIGVSRILSVLSLKQFLPCSVSPFKLHLVGIDYNKSKEIYEKYNKNDNILWDERDVSPGTKFNDADAIKIPYRLVIGNNMELYFKNELLNIDLNNFLENL